jgi:hypothetical protein
MWFFSSLATTPQIVYTARLGYDSKGQPKCESVVTTILSRSAIFFLVQAGQTGNQVGDNGQTSW